MVIGVIFVVVQARGALAATRARAGVHAHNIRRGAASHALTRAHNRSLCARGACTTAWWPSPARRTERREAGGPNAAATLDCSAARCAQRMRRHTAQPAAAREQQRARGAARGAGCSTLRKCSTLPQRHSANQSTHPRRRLSSSSVAATARAAVGYCGGRRDGETASGTMQVCVSPIDLPPFARRTWPLAGTRSGLRAGRRACVRARVQSFFASYIQQRAQCSNGFGLLRRSLDGQLAVGLLLLPVQLL